VLKILLNAYDKSKRTYREDSNGLQTTFVHKLAISLYLSSSKILNPLLAQYGFSCS